MEGDPSAHGVLDAEQAFLNAMREAEQQSEESKATADFHEAAGQMVKEESQEIEDIAEISPTSEDHEDTSAAEYTPTTGENTGPAFVAGAPLTIQSPIVQEKTSSGAEDNQYDPSQVSGEKIAPVIVDRKSNGDTVGTNGTHFRETSSAPLSTPTPGDITIPSAPAAPENHSESILPSGQAVSTTHHSHKRKRLPQDIVGQLEDRISEDPRGDVEAWLALINEHQKKGKFDEAREAYERFLQIWPSAVSCPLQMCCIY